MALPPLAEVSDLADWTGRSIDPSDPRAGAVLLRASALVRAYTGQTWTNAGGDLQDVPEVVAGIVVQVAARVWMNPAGLSSITVDDATRRWGADGSGGLMLTDAEKAVLADYMDGGAPADLGVVSFTRGPLGNGTVYVPTGPPPSGPPFPWYSSEDLP